MHQPTPWYRTGLGTDESKWNIVQSAVKDEDNFVCECDNPDDAKLIIDAVNAKHCAQQHLVELRSNEL